MQLIKVGLVNPLLIALDLIPQFADFLSKTTPNFDKVPILGDFNIHDCHPSKPLGSECMHLVKSFNLKKITTGPTRKLGHTFNLVLLLCFPVSNMEIIDDCLSDQSTVVFDPSAFLQLSLISLFISLASLTLWLPINSMMRFLHTTLSQRILYPYLSPPAPPP